MSKINIKKIRQFSHSYQPRNNKMAEIARLRRKAKALQKEIRDIYADIQRLTTAEMQYVWEHNIADEGAWGPNWSSELTKIQRLQFERSWKRAFKASDGELMPSLKTYIDLVKGRRQNLRNNTPDKYLKYAISQAKGYDNPGNVNAIADKVEDTYGEEANDIVAYLREHADSIPAGVAQEIYTIAYESADNLAEDLQKMSDLLGIKFEI